MYLSIFAYLSTVLTNRVFAVIRDHRVRSVIFNVIVILIAVLLALTSLSVDRDVESLVWVVVLYLIAVAGAALLHIIRISFSQISSVS
jgi:hypothetical protein